LIHFAQGFARHAFAIQQNAIMAAMKISRTGDFFQRPLGANFSGVLAQEIFLA
jgi:hypothetical protein